MSQGWHGRRHGHNGARKDEQRRGPVKPDMADENGRFLPACVRGGDERGNGHHDTLHGLRYITALLSELVIYGTAALLFEPLPGGGILLGGESILTREVWVWC